MAKQSKALLKRDVKVGYLLAALFFATSGTEGGVFVGNTVSYLKWRGD